MRGIRAERALAPDEIADPSGRRVEGGPDLVDLANPGRLRARREVTFAEAFGRGHDLVDGTHESPGLTPGEQRRDAERAGADETHREPCSPGPRGDRGLGPARTQRADDLGVAVDRHRGDDAAAAAAVVRVAAQREL